MRDNEEYHAFIDCLAERKYTGEVTLYFQNGNIESSRKSERTTKTETKEAMRGIRQGNC